MSEAPRKSDATRHQLSYDCVTGCGRARSVGTLCATCTNRLDGNGFEHLHGLASE